MCESHSCERLASIDADQLQKQPPVLPRPDLNALGVKYRRIPVMAIGRDIYCDSRIMLQKLEEMFPEGALGASTAEEKALEKLLEIWSIEAGVFVRASQLIPVEMPLLKDPKFAKDREDYSGRPWSKEAIAANRPEALSAIRNAFSFLETGLLADGRKWVLKGDQPTLADIEGRKYTACHYMLANACANSYLDVRLAERLERRVATGVDL